MAAPTGPKPLHEGTVGSTNYSINQAQTDKTQFTVTIGSQLYNVGGIQAGGPNANTNAQTLKELVEAILSNKKVQAELLEPSQHSYSIRTLGKTSTPSKMNAEIIGDSDSKFRESLKLSPVLLQKISGLFKATVGGKAGKASPVVSGAPNSIILQPLDLEEKDKKSKFAGSRPLRQLPKKGPPPSKSKSAAATATSASASASSKDKYDAATATSASADDAADVDDRADEKAKDEKTKHASPRPPPSLTGSTSSTGDGGDDYS